MRNPVFVNAAELQQDQNHVTCTSVPWQVEPILAIMQGLAPGRMKGLLVSHNGDLYIYGGMPHTAFTSNRTLTTTSFAYPDGDTVFMKLNSGSGKWHSVSCAGAVPESRTRIHSGHAGECSSPIGK